MGRADRARQAVLRHLRHFIGFFLGEQRVGGHHADNRVAALGQSEDQAPGVRAHHRERVGEPVLPADPERTGPDRPRAGEDLPALRVDHVAEGVHGDQRADHDPPAAIDARAADPALHGARLAEDLADRASRSRARIALRRAIGGRLQARPVSHLGVRPDFG